MADFHQSEMITTLHRFRASDLSRLETQLAEFKARNPIALVLPVTPAELDSPALRGIIQNLADVPYLNEIVIVLGRTQDPAHFERARAVFGGLPQDKRLIWAAGPSLGELYRRLDREGLSAGADGKGRSAWIAYGHILARGRSRVIALHDCDIVNYGRELLARLCYPCASPQTDYVFAKGYYARVTDRMHGRVTRLFVTPLLRSLIRLFGHLPFLVYLDGFRYPLAGEFSMLTDAAWGNRIPGDWGLEVETLAEVFRNYSPRRICQVEVAETYEHKHQPLSAENPATGLMKMAIDIAKSIFRNLAVECITLGESGLRTLVVNYQRTAKDMIKRHGDDAALNGLAFDYHQEALSVEAFTRALEAAGKDFLQNPLYSPLIPSWNRVTSAIPDFLDRLVDVVERENQGWAGGR